MKKSVLILSFLISLIFFSCSDQLSPIINKSEGAISGYLSSPESTPIKGAIVVLNAQDTLASNDNGFFMFQNLESGLYFINIYADGYRDTTIQNISVDGNSETPLSIIELQKKSNYSSNITPINVTFNILDNTYTRIANDQLLTVEIDTTISNSPVKIQDGVVKFTTTQGTHQIRIKYSDFIDTIFTQKITSDFGEYQHDIVLTKEKVDPSVLSFTASLENNNIDLETPAKLLLTKDAKNEISKIAIDFDGDNVYESYLLYWSLEKLYTYSKPGEYTISVKIFDNKGYSSTQTLNITVL